MAKDERERQIPTHAKRLRTRRTIHNLARTTAKITKNGKERPQSELLGVPEEVRLGMTSTTYFCKFCNQSYDKPTHWVIHLQENLASERYTYKHEETLEERLLSMSNNPLRGVSDT